MPSGDFAVCWGRFRGFVCFASALVGLGFRVIMAIECGLCRLYDGLIGASQG